MIRVAAYCRVSTDKEDQANSFEAQQRYFRAYIAGHPEWILHDIYADEGITGTSTKKRFQFNRMIAEAYAGKFTLILTKEISRFSRNILDTITYTRELKQIGVGVYFLSENLNSLDPESEMMLTFMGTLAQEESRRTSARVKWGQTRRMEQGVVFGHSLLGYDVRNGKLTVNEAEAALVRLIFRKYAIEQKGTSTIAREMRSAGYLTKTGNSRWNHSYIVKLLRNEKYVGDLVQKKSYTPDYLTHAKQRNQGQEELIVLRDHHEAIVSREIWETAQAELARRDKHAGTGRSNRYLFSGKIKCGECGASFVGRQKTSQDGTMIRRWRCATAAGEGVSGCAVGKLIRDDDARNMLKTALKNLDLDRAGIIDEITKIAMRAVLAGEGGDSPARLQRQLEAAMRKKEICLDAYFSGDITKAEMQALKAKYDTMITDLRQRLHAPQPTTDQTAIRNAVTDLLNGRRESDAFYRSFLDRLTVYQDRHLELRLKDLPHVFRFEG